MIYRSTKKSGFFVWKDHGDTGWFSFVVVVLFFFLEEKSMCRTNTDYVFNVVAIRVKR